MKWSKRRAAGTVMMAGGVLMAGIGLFWAAAYVYRALDILDESDRSWLFWGLAILFLGIILVRLGIKLALRGRMLMRTSDSDRAAGAPT